MKIQKVIIETNNGIEISFPIKEKYSVSEFIEFSQHLSKGLNSINEEFEKKEVSKKHKWINGKNKYDFRAVQKAINNTKLTYEQIEKKFGMSENSIYRYFKQKWLVRRR